MHALQRWLMVAALLIGCGVAGVPPGGGVQAQGAQAPTPAHAPGVLSRAEQEIFLAKARIVRTRSVSTGVTGTLRATLTDGRFTHDASIQTVDEYRNTFEGRRGTELNFRDTWRYNVAAYRLDRLLDLGMLPPSVERSYQGRPAAFTWWVDDVLMDEGARLRKKIAPPDARRWNEQMWHVRLFDQLIDNTDRNLGNLLIDTEWRIWMIDHTRAFRLGESPRAPANIGQCDRGVFDRLKALDLPGLTAAMERYLLAPEIKALLLRRDAIVEHLEKTNALFEWQRPSRLPSGSSTRNSITVSSAWPYLEPCGSGGAKGLSKGLVSDLHLQVNTGRITTERGAMGAIETAVRADDAAVATKAVLRAAARLGLPNRALAGILGVSEASVSRMGSGAYWLAPGEKPFELAMLFIRLYRSLDALVGGDEASARAWLQREHTLLGAPPAALIQTVSGLVTVLGYLDARRALV